MILCTDRCRSQFQLCSEEQVQTGIMLKARLLINLTEGTSIYASQIQLQPMDVQAGQVWVSITTRGKPPEQVTTRVSRTRGQTR